jgi:molybdopterin-containing oxidoreductase family membrane subunit
MHTVTALLYAGFAGRPFWNNAVLAPRFLVSAVATGTAALLLASRAMEEEDDAPPLATDARVPIERLLGVALAVDLFLLAAQAFVELYAQGAGATPLRYLLFGLGRHRALVPWAWLGAVLQIAAAVFFMLPRAARDRVARVGAVPTEDLFCAAALIGIWFSKGMALVIPGFVPSQLGEMVEYVPSLVEALVSLGVWCFGLGALSVLLRLERAAILAARPS